jgi:hypothetical protein
MAGALKHIECMLGEDGVGWDTAWAAVELHGSPLVMDRRRVGRVRALGVDEHSYLSATPEHSTIYATSLVDLDWRIVIDLFEGKVPPSCADSAPGTPNTGSRVCGSWLWTRPSPIGPDCTRISPTPDAWPLPST